MNKQIKYRILLAEDVKSDRIIIEEHLKINGLFSELMHVETSDTFREALGKFYPTLIISDYNMERFTGMEALQTARELAPMVPFIILTGSMNEDTAVECMKQGADDYVVKSNLKRLVPAIQAAMQKKASYAEKIQAEKALRKSEEKYRAMIESSNDSIFIIADGLIQYANPELIRVSGYKERELIGSDFSKFVAPEEVPKVMNYYRQRLAGKKVPAKYESVAMAWHNQRKEVEVSIIPIEYEGKIAEQVILRDISQRKKAERALKKSEQKYRDIINLSPVGFYQTRRDGTFELVNKQMAAILGYEDVDELQGKNIEGLYFNPQQRQEIIEKFDNSQADIIKEQEIPLIKKDGTPVWVCITARTLRNHDNQPTGYDGFVSDITARKHAQEDLKESEAKLRSIIENSQNGICVINDKMQFTFINQTISKLFGYTREELLNRDFRNFLPDSSKEVVFTMYKKRQKGGDVPLTYQFDMFDSSGKLRTVEINSSVVTDKNDRKNTIVHLADVTQRIKHEKIRETILSISQISFQEGNLKKYLSRVHKEIKKVVKADNFYVALYNKKTGKYSFPYHVDEYENYQSQEEASLEGSLTDFVRQSSQGQFVNAEREKELQEQHDIQVVGEYSPIWLGAPLLKHESGEAIGVIAVQDYHDPNAFSKEDLELMEIIANNIGTFIERVRNMEQLQQAKLSAEEGERKYKSLFNDNASAMLLIEPETGKIVDANKSALEFYGYTHAQLTSMKIQQINTLDDASIKADMQKAKKKGRNYSEFRHRLANGAIRNVEEYSGNVTLEGKPLLYSIIHDVTRKKQAEAEVTRLYEAINQAPVAMALSDLKGIFVYVNPSFCHLSKFSRNELIGRHTRILKSGKQDKAFYKNLWSTITNDQTWKGEMTNKRKDGSEYLEEALISPLCDDEGNKTHYVKVARDITQQREMEQDLVWAKEQAEESDRLKSAFLANMSHEIRTPMNGILGFTDLLEDPKYDADEKRRFIQSIHKSGQRMLDTVNDLIDISKIEAGQVTLSLSDVNVNEQMQSLYNFFNQEAAKKGLEMHHHLPLKDKQVAIHTDRAKLNSIMTNLVKNAIKYTDEGSVEFGYELEKAPDQDYLKFYVKDTGIGIPPSRQDAIFNRFEQADIEDTRAFQGSGLGLAIAKSYVELLCGQIWMESEEGEGSIFYFTVPMITVIGIATSK
ncbi:MAG: PAS domain S-box protein [Bacteroidales bacterium]|nr:PAS domain S-box protein [Bacteroidales bacterium]MCF8333547.1 PAS domain S-box protein [Bacteroidales bacterium]